MPTRKQLSQGIQDVLFGDPWGETFPPKANPQGLPLVGRTIALRTLKQYLSELEFLRLGDSIDAPPIPFRIKAEDIHIEWPDSEDQLRFPSLVFLNQGQGEYETIGLTGYVEEDSRDKYGIGTVVQWQSEYVETLIIEIRASKRSERRSVISGLETAMSPTEQMYGIRFRLPDYFNELVCFTLNSRELLDDENSAKDRRVARLYFEMRYTVVALVNYTEFVAGTPVIQVQVDVNQDTNVPITRADLSADVTIDPTLPRHPPGPPGPFGPINS